MIELMIKNGATKLNEGLEIACKDGNIELVQLLINYGATDVASGLDTASRNNHRKLVDILKSMMDDIYFE